MKRFLLVTLAMAILASGCWVGPMEYMESNQMRIPLPLRGSISEGPIYTVSEVCVSTGSQCGSASVTEVREQRGNRHPEQRADEVFETNCTLEEFGSIPYATKRAGKISYDAHGQPFQVFNGKKYVPVFVKKVEWFMVNAMGIEKRYPLHFWTRNHYFDGAQVTIVGFEGCTSAGREIKKTFRLNKERTLGRSWENQIVVPANFCLMEVIVKPVGKKAIKFLMAGAFDEGGRVNILLSSCPLTETFARPRVIMSQDSRTEKRFWAPTFRAPDNMPALFR